MPHFPYIDITLMLVGFAGFSIASYIYHRKHVQKPVICPMLGSCEAVTESDYSKFLGIPVERLGMVYYMAVFLFHSVVLVNPALFNPTTALVGFLVVTAAFLFSLYLVSVQAFALKHWCTWCLTSALICTIIFVLTCMGTPMAIF